MNIVENATSDKLSKGDLRKAWGRLERRWNPKTREDKVEVYTKFLNYKLENTRQKPMDWLAFLEKKHTELANTGYKMDDETFITHLLNSIPQSEYEGAILVIKVKLRKGSMLSAGMKRKISTKGDAKGKGHNDMSKNKSFNCGEYGHFAHDCPKACDNANIGQESEQNKKVENMLDLDNISVSEECVMMSTEVHYEDAEEDVVVYRDQGINTEEYEKATYGDLMKTQSEDKEEVKYNVALCANKVCHWKGRRGDLMKQHPTKMYTMLVRAILC